MKTTQTTQQSRTPQLTSNDQGQDQGQDEQSTVGNSALIERSQGSDPDPEELQAEVAAAKDTIRRACAGWGTDEDAIFDCLSKLSPDAKIAIAGDDEVAQLLRDDLTSSELDRANQILGTNQTKEVMQFNTDLGRAEDYSGIAQAVGGFLEALAPLPGMCFSGKLELEFGCTGFGLDFGFEIEGERTAEGFDLGLKLEIFVGYKANLGVFKAKVGAKLSGAAKGKGDSAVECMGLIGLGLHTKIGDWLSQGAADTVFGADYQAAMLANMDAEPDPSEEPVDPGPDADEDARQQYEDAKAAYDARKAEADSAELSFGIAGAGGFTGASGGPMEGTDLSAELGGERSTTISKDHTGRLKKDTTDYFVYKQKLVIRGFGIELEVKAGMGGSRKASLEVKGVGDLPFDAVDDQLLTGAVTQLVAGVVSAATGAMRASGNDRAEAAATGVAKAVVAPDYTVLAGVPGLLAQDAGSDAWGGSINAELSLKHEADGDQPSKTGLELKIMNVHSFEFNAVVAEGKFEYKTGQKITLV